MTKYIFILITILFALHIKTLFAQQGTETYFIAVDIPDDVETTIDNVAGTFRKTLFGTFEPKQKFHITLKYLGAMPKESLSRIERILRNTLNSRYCFDIRVEQAGFFPDPKNARVIWFGVKSESLRHFYDEIEKSLTEFAKPEKNFTPHITIGRLSCPPPLWLIENIKEQVTSYKTIAEFEVKEILLLQSYQGKYTVVFSFPLKKGKETSSLKEK